MSHLNYATISSVTSFTLGGAASHAYLYSVNVTTAVATAVITITDATSGATVAVIDASAKGSYWFGGLRVPGGIKVQQTVAASTATIGYR